jgi:ribosome-binding factor A
LHRVAGQIKKEISDIIRDEIKDPRVTNAITTITDVQVSRDLSHAWVYFSVLRDNDDEKEIIIQALDKASGFIRTEVGKRIRLRHIPEIHFVFDQSIEYGAHIDKVLKKIIPEKES